MRNTPTGADIRGVWLRNSEGGSNCWDREPRENRLNFVAIGMFRKPARIVGRPPNFQFGGMSALRCGTQFLGLGTVRRDPFELRRFDKVAPRTRERNKMRSSVAGA
jgi:hypothetical protein